jgi:hypothetical protein
VSQAIEYLLAAVLVTCLCAAGLLLTGPRRRPAGRLVREPRPATHFSVSPPRVAVPGPDPGRGGDRTAAGETPDRDAVRRATAAAVRQQRQNTSAAGRIVRLREHRSQPAGVSVGHR